MILWKKSVGESRANCSRVMVLDRKRRVDKTTGAERMEDEGVECRQTNGVVETEHGIG